MLGKKSLTALLLSIILIFAASCVDKVRFTFDWPDGLTFYENYKQTKVNKMGELAFTDVIEARSEIHVQKTDSGYIITSTSLSMKGTRDGKPVNNPVFSLLTDITVTYHLDTNGQILSIKGYDKLADVIAASFSPAVARQLSAVLDEEALVEKDMTSWQSRISDFVGAEAKIGDVFYREEKTTLPVAATATYYSVAKILGKAKCGDRDCALIGYAYNSNPEEVRDFMGKFYANFAAVADSSSKGTTVLDVEITGEGQRLIDPRTMLPFSETGTRSIRMQIDVPDEGPMDVSIHETREYTWEY